MRFNRVERLVGRKDLEKLKGARVALCGLGAVGSYVAEALARSGVGYLRLVDFDRIEMSNINRQLLALESTVGKFKTEVAKARIKEINPLCDVDIRDVFIDEDTLPEMLADLDVVVDAIDTVASKVTLISGAFDRSISVVSSMGAADRMDVNAVHTGDISESYNCPLARVIRKRLHSRGIREGIRCVFSPERSDRKKTATVPRADPMAKREPLGSICCVTGIFGLKVASEVVHLVLER